MPSVFTKIVLGEIPCYKIAETERSFAFLDINPLEEGHVLAIPKHETDYLFDLDNKSFEELMLFSKKIALAIKAAVPCKRIGVAVVGFEVPHAHVHLVPINGIYDIDFSKPKLSFTEDEFQATAERIRRAL